MSTPNQTDHVGEIHRLGTSRSSAALPSSPLCVFLDNDPAKQMDGSAEANLGVPARSPAPIKRMIGGLG
jgi:hypothetical protein